MDSQETGLSSSVANLSPEIAFQLKLQDARTTQSAILSSVFPIRDKTSSNEQSAGLGTGEEGAATSMIMSLSNVVSFDMSRNKDKNALKTANASNIHPYASIGTFDEDDEDEDDERIIKGRERNREHARKTRLRKKVQLQELEQKYRSMLAERQTLNQQVHDRNIASILLGLSSSTTPAITTTSSSTSACSTTGPSDHVRVEDVLDHKADMTKADIQLSTRRKRGFPEVQLPTNIAPLTININGTPTAITSKSHINWKTGMYCDEMGRQSQMTPQQLEDLRYVVLYQNLPMESKLLYDAALTSSFFQMRLFYVDVSAIVCMLK
jgi:hypothetical protein